MRDTMLRIFGPPTLGPLRVPQFLHRWLRISQDPQEHRQQWMFLWLGLLVTPMSILLIVMRLAVMHQADSGTIQWIVCGIGTGVTVLWMSLVGRANLLFWVLMVAVSTMTTINQSLHPDNPMLAAPWYVLIVLAALTRSTWVPLLPAGLGAFSTWLALTLAPGGFAATNAQLPDGLMFVSRMSTLMAVTLVSMLGAHSTHRTTREITRHNAANLELTDELRMRRDNLEQLVAQRTTELQQRTTQLHSLNEELDDALRRQRELADRFKVRSRTDHLTGLLNRRGFMEDLQHLPGDAGWLLMIDVDHFKQLNDTYGHPVGDEALRRVSTALQQNTPAGAIVGRVGGEEFALALPGALDRDTVTGTVERLMRSVRHLQWDDLGLPQTARVTISVGAAPWGCDSPHEPLQLQIHDVIRRADRALYCAKDDGRDRLRFAQAPTASHAG